MALVGTLRVCTIHLSFAEHLVGDPVRPDGNPIINRAGAVVVVPGDPPDHFPAFGGRVLLHNVDETVREAAAPTGRVDKDVVQKTDLLPPQRAWHRPAMGESREPTVQNRGETDQRVTVIHQPAPGGVHPFRRQLDLVVVRVAPVEREPRGMIALPQYPKFDVGHLVPSALGLVFMFSVRRRTGLPSASALRSRGLVNDDPGRPAIDGWGSGPMGSALAA